MKSKSFTLVSLSILALVMFMSFTSAASLELDLVTSTPITVLHDQGTVTISFNVSNNGATNYTALNWSGSSSGVGSWTTLPSLTSINVGDTVEVSAILTFPEYSSGTINAEIDLQSETSAEAQLPITITISSTPSLSVSDATIPEGEDSINITIANEGNVDLTGIELTQSGDFDVSFSENNFNLVKGIDKEITITITSNLDDLELGENKVTITATADDDTSATGTITTERSFCKCEDNGNLEIDFDITNNGFGDEEEWFLFDEIEVEIEVENKGDEKIKDIVVEWGLYNKDTGEWVIDDEENEFDLKEDKDKKITIKFKLDDLDEFEDNGDYIFYVKATGEDQEYDGNETCESKSESIEIMIEDDFVILDDFEFSETVSCGTELQVLADVWNIGEDNQDEVYVMIYNQDLGIDKKVEIGDIDAFDDEKLNTILNIPNNAEEKTHHIRFRVYNDNDEIYENNDDKKAEFFIHLNVEGGCSVESTAVVSAEVESGGKAGDKLVIKATITNTGDKLATYVLNAATYAEWASSAEFDQTIAILNSGESKEVLITFEVNKDVSGDKTFDIEVLSGDELIVKQPVSVLIEKSGFSFFTGNMISGENKYLWGIGILNIVLIIIIIFVALKFAKK